MATGSGIKAELLDELLAGRDAKNVFEQDGLLDELKKALAERILNAELGAGRIRRWPVGRQVSGDRAELASELGAGDPVLCVSGRGAAHSSTPPTRSKTCTAWFAKRCAGAVIFRATRRPPG